MLLAKGAEANLYQTTFMGEKAVLKRRNRKAYRQHSLDVQLRERRTKMEARIMHAVKPWGVRCPLVYDVDVARKEILMQFIEGKLLAVLLKPGASKTASKYLKEAGAMLAAMHSSGYVHGDFTPYNIIVSKEGAWFIDFGLSENSGSLEQRATDLLVFRKSVSEKDFAILLAAYQKSAKNSKQVLSQLGEIERRGRYVVRAQMG